MADVKKLKEKKIVNKNKTVNNEPFNIANFYVKNDNKDDKDILKNNDFTETEKNNIKKNLSFLTIFMISFLMILLLVSNNLEFKKTISTYENKVNILEKYNSEKKNIISELTKEIEEIKTSSDNTIKRMQERDDYLSKEVARIRSFGCISDDGVFYMNGNVGKNLTNLCRNGVLLFPNK